MVTPAWVGRIHTAASSSGSFTSLSKWGNSPESAVHVPLTQQQLPAPAAKCLGLSVDPIVGLEGSAPAGARSVDGFGEHT